jgi:dolichol-phosphate mannosyltransferase
MSGSRPHLSLIVPTYNEAANLTPLITLIDNSLKGTSYEVIVVDDNSPDRTGVIAKGLVSQYPVVVIHRKGKLGLASAALEGFRAANGKILGCMDADLSHPPELLPVLISTIKDEGYDMAVASRLVEGAGVVGNWPQYRKLNSYIATILAMPLTSVKDSMSGYFMLRREVIDGVSLTPVGYKIGLEILVKGKHARVIEVPFLFDNRSRGKSKMDLKVQMQFLQHVTNLYVYKMKKFLMRSKHR